jgi:hypothetical protein
MRAELATPDRHRFVRIRRDRVTKIKTVGKQRQVPTFDTLQHPMSGYFALRNAGLEGGAFT